MVDLPKVPRRLATTEAPKSSLSAADIRAPYAALAQGLNDAGGALTEIAVAHAEDAGAQSVQVDAEGKVTVSRAPVVGAAAAPYERAIRVGAVAGADARADRALIDMREQFRGDPDGFQKAAAAFRDKTVAEFNVGPAAQAALQRQIDNRITQTYSGLLYEHQSTGLRRANESIEARILTMGNEMETLARRNGIGPEFEDRFNNVRTLLNEKVNNPLLAYPKEKADAYMDALTTRVQGAAIHEQMERVYRERGFEAARDYLKSSVRDLDGKVKQLDQIERTGLAWLRSEEAGFRGERDMVSREWAAAKPQIATLPRDSLMAIRDAAAAVGNHRVAQDVDAHLYALDHLSAIRQMPAGERAAVAVTGTMPQNMTPMQRDVQSVIEAEARRQGVDPRVATAIGWRESSFNPNAAPPQKPGGPTLTARGVFQLIGPNQQRFGITADSPVQDQVSAGITMIKETTDQLRTSLGREPSAAEVYMGHFQGAGTAVAIIRANPDVPLKTVLDQAKPNFRGPNGETWGDTVIKSNPFLGQLGTVGAFRDWAGRAMGDQQRTDLTETRGGLLALRMVNREMGREITAEITNLRQTISREEFPPVADVIALGEKVHAIGTPEQQREVNELVAIAKVGQQFMSLPAPQRQQLVSEADAELRGGAARFDARLRSALRKADEDITKAYKTDPYGAYYRFSRSEAAQPTPAVDFAQPEMAGQILALRMKQQAVIREEQSIGPFSALRPAEVEAMRGVLASGDAKATAGVFAALNQLPDDVLAATLRDPNVKSGITGAIHTTDPGKFNAVMSALDIWHARDPIEFPKRFGDEAWHSLKDWQANLRYLSPEQLAEERRKALDPQAAEQRKRNLVEGQKIARTYTVEQVVAGIGAAWSVTPGFIATNITRSQGLPPVDSGTRDALMGDYETMFERRYAATRNKDQAHEQAVEALRTKWSRSEVNGGQLMLRPPESVYPAIGGDHKWMTPQIERELTAQLGVGRSTIGTNVLGGAVGMVGAVPVPLPVLKSNWDYVLVSDRMTETGAQRYDKALPPGEDNRPPSYQVMIRDNRKQRPQWEPLRDGQGQSFRFSFDPNPDQERARREFEATRARDTELRTAREARGGRVRAPIPEQ